MNYIIALAFVITSLLSVLSFHLWISTLTALQWCLRGRKKEKRNYPALPPNQVWKCFLSCLRHIWHIYGALLEEWPFNAIYRKHTFIIWLAEVRDRAFVIITLQLHIQLAWGTEKLHAINNGSRLWKENSVGYGSPTLYFKGTEEVDAHVGKV